MSDDVEIALAPGSKCMRCWKITPEVGLHPEHDDVCLRCVSVLTDEPFDVFELAAIRFDRLYQEARASGLSKEEAVIKAGRQNNGYDI